MFFLKYIFPYRDLDLLDISLCFLCFISILYDFKNNKRISFKLSPRLYQHSFKLVVQVSAF